ncbi:MAG: replication initiator protein [Microviridae sp.]|nr:MAG: replication initiator protein [Microviridae sp.]
MPCYSPLHGYKARKVTHLGKRQFVFSRKNGYSDLAFTVPCGQCIGCRIDRSRHWALRCVHEAKMHSASCFVTLTYDDDHLPKGGTLVKSDLQKFFKRLRKLYPFRYYAAGEYGDEGQRPHYHAILFGINFFDDRKIHTKKKTGTLFTSETLTKTWGLGHCLIADFSYSTAAYTARYIMKKQVGKNGHEAPQYERLDPSTGEIGFALPEFALMSLKPGLGSGWYDKYHKDAFPSDFLVHQGKKHPVPRFYYQKLKISNPELHRKIQLKRIEKRDETKDNSTTERLRTREVVKKSQLSNLQRNLK